MLLHSDLVFCAIPFSTSCYKKVDQVSETAAQLPSTSVRSLEPKPIPVGDPEQAVLTPSGKHSSQTHPGETRKENGKENMEETTGEDASAYPESD
nr:potassium channel subfamily U member 1-like [Delphinus delphis]